MPTFAAIPQFTSMGNYEVTIPWGHLLDTLEGYTREHGLDMNPDFQRGYVWTREQQQRYVEFILRGGKSGRVILFNHPGWMKSFKGDMVLVDGKQRLQAVRNFLVNIIPAFGCHYYEYTDSLRMIDTDFRFNVNNLKTRKEVLQYYLHFNDGGTVHTQAELNNVRELIIKECAHERSTKHSVEDESE